MSRTDSHRPWWTRLSEKGLAVEEHNHVKSACDLPTLKEWVHLYSSNPDSMKNYYCRWTMSNSAWATNPSCGCKMCSKQDYRQRERRKSRHVSNIQSHQIVRENHTVSHEEEGE